MIGRVLLSLVLGVCVVGCTRVAKEPDPALVNRAIVWGEMRGREAAFFAQEMTMMHPNSERSREGRRRLLEVEKMLRGENSVEEEEELE